MDATSKSSSNTSMDANGKTSTVQNLITLSILAANIQGASNITDSRYKFGILATYEEESKKGPIDITFLSETWYDQDIHVHEKTAKTSSSSPIFFFKYHFLKNLGVLLNFWTHI